MPGDKLLKIQTVCQQLTEDLMTLSDDFVAEQRLSGWMTQQNTGAKAAAKNFCLPTLAANVKGKNHTLAKIKISVHKFCFCCVICRTKEACCDCPSEPNMEARSDPTPASAAQFHLCVTAQSV